MRSKEDLTALVADAIWLKDGDELLKELSAMSDVADSISGESDDLNTQLMAAMLCDLTWIIGLIVKCSTTSPEIAAEDYDPTQGA